MAPIKLVNQGLIMHPIYLIVVCSHIWTRLTMTLKLYKFYSIFKTYVVLTNILLTQNISKINMFQGTMKPRLRVCSRNYYEVIWSYLFVSCYVLEVVKQCFIWILCYNEVFKISIYTMCYWTIIHTWHPDVSTIGWGVTDWYQSLGYRELGY